MILKLFAYGTYGYIKDAYNVFDFIIVSISIYEVIEKLQTNNLINESHHSGISVLRTFRLLRIIKFIRFLPTMRRQFFVLLNSFNNVASFMSLLSLFIFIFRYNILIISNVKFFFLNKKYLKYFGNEFIWMQVFYNRARWLEKI